MSLLRIPFVLSAALVAQFASTPPNPPPEESEKAMPTGFEVIFTKMLPWMPATSKMIVWLWSFVEVAVIVAGARPSLPLSLDIISTFVRSTNPAAAASRIRVTPPFFVAWLLMISGGLIRLSSYKALGRLFTYEISIRKDHKLITSGPYSVVRHPGYIGLLMMTFGYIFCFMGSGSWFRECSGFLLDGTMTQGLVSAWAMSILLVFVARANKEDEMLRKEFSDWNEWAKKIMYRMVYLKIDMIIP